MPELGRGQSVIEFRMDWHEFPRAAITENHRPGGLITRDVFSHILEEVRLRPGCDRAGSS